MICTKCKENKPETSEYFPLHNKKKNGLDSWCRSCRSSYRSNTRRGKYRSMISDDRLMAIFNSTKQCTICGDETDLVVDHCHKTQKVRGLLCNHCNKGLGHFRDDPDLLEYARIYLLAATDAPEADEYLEKRSNSEDRQNV